VTGRFEAEDYGSDQTSKRPWRPSFAGPTGSVLCRRTDGVCLARSAEAARLGNRERTRSTWAGGDDCEAGSAPVRPARLLVRLPPGRRHRASSARMCRIWRTERLYSTESLEIRP
jgi:hypothetical protein